MIKQLIQKDIEKREQEHSNIIWLDACDDNVKFSQFGFVEKSLIAISIWREIPSKEEYQKIEATLQRPTLHYLVTEDKINRAELRKGWGVINITGFSEYSLLRSATIIRSDNNLDVLELIELHLGAEAVEHFIGLDTRKQIIQDLDKAIIEKRNNRGKMLRMVSEALQAVDRFKESNKE